MWNLKPFSIYTLCSQKQNYVFSMWNKKKLFKYFNLKEQESIFSMWDKKPFEILF
jgi:hypothetical protein